MHRVFSLYTATYFSTKNIFDSSFIMIFFNAAGRIYALLILHKRKFRSGSSLASSEAQKVMEQRR